MIRPFIWVPKSAGHMSLSTGSVDCWKNPAKKAPCRGCRGATLGLQQGGRTKLHDIPILEDSLVHCIWGPVRRHIVQRAPCGKGDACFQPILRDELTHRLLKLLTELRHCNARLGDASYVGPHL